MLKSDIALIQSTFQDGKTDPEIIAANFYDMLFDMAPQVRTLFADDMAVQVNKLADMLGIAVMSLDKQEALSEQLRALGAAHVGYGALPAHYSAVADALLRTLAHALGPRWTDEMAAAWGRLLDFVAAHMIAGAVAAGSSAKPEAAA